MKLRYYSAITLLIMSSLYFIANFLLILNLDSLFAQYSGSLANDTGIEFKSIILKIWLAGGYITQFSLPVLISSSVFSCIFLYFSYLNFDLVKQGLDMKIIFTKEYWLDPQLRTVSYKAPRRKRIKKPGRKKQRKSQ